MCRREQIVYGEPAKREHNRIVGAQAVDQVVGVVGVVGEGAHDTWAIGKNAEAARGFLARAHGRVAAHGRLPSRAAAPIEGTHSGRVQETDLGVQRTAHEVVVARREELRGRDARRAREGEHEGLRIGEPRARA